MDLATARTRATISVPEAGELLGLGRDASFRAAHAGEIPTLHFGRRLRVPVAALLAQLGEPLEHLRPTSHDGALDTETDSEVGVRHADLGSNVLTLTKGARRGHSDPPTPT